MAEKDPRMIKCNKELSKTFKGYQMTCEKNCYLSNKYPASAITVEYIRKYIHDSWMNCSISKAEVEDDNTLFP